MEKRYLECAKVASTHGVHGALRLISLCDSAQVLASLPRMFRKTRDGYEEMKVASSFVHKAMAVVTFETITSLDEAIPMKNAVLYAAREDFDLPNGAFFITDLIGLEVRDEDTMELYGTLKDVISPAGRDIYVVQGENGEFMVPCVPEFVIRIAPDEGRITIRPIEGLLG